MTHGIREKAARMLAEQRALSVKQRESAESYHRYLIRESIGAILGLALTPTDGVPHGPRLELDGLLFEHPAELSSNNDLRLVYRCDSCGQDLISVPVRDGVHLGEMLKEPQLDKAGVCVNGVKHHPGHWCEFKSSPPSAGRRGRVLEI